MVFYIHREKMKPWFNIHETVYPVGNVSGQGISSAMLSSAT